MKCAQEVTDDEFANMMAAIEKDDAERAAAMPDTRAALRQISAAKDRLRKLGWRDGMYCPKDGSEFAVVEFGSTGIHCGHYIGKWPSGSVYIGDFLSNPSGLMFKEISALSSDDLSEMQRSIQSDKEFMEWQLEIMSGSQ